MNITEEEAKLIESMRFEYSDYNAKPWHHDYDPSEWEVHDDDLLYYDNGETVQNVYIYYEAEEDRYYVESQFTELHPYRDGEMADWPNEFPGGTFEEAVRFVKERC